MNTKNRSNRRQRKPSKQKTEDKCKGDNSSLETVPWKNHEICIIENSDECRALVTTLRSHCKDYNVLGIDCDSVEYNKQKISLLLLSTSDGLCALIRLLSTGTVPTELKNILEDENILKVTVQPVKVALKLTAYGVLVASVFDLRYLATKCDSQPWSLAKLSIEHLKVGLTEDHRLNRQRWKRGKLDKNDIDYAAKKVRVAIELFKLFEEKLNNSAAGNALPKFIDEYCKEHLNKSYREESPNRTVANASEATTVRTARTLPQPTNLIVDTEERCKELLQQLRDYTDKSKMLGFSCKYSPSRVVNLLQLATHDGVCAFIQLSKFKPIPSALKEFLEDENIIKIGENTFGGADRLEQDYNIYVKSTLDVRHLAKECNCRSVDLDRLSEEHLNVDLSVPDWRLLAIDWSGELPDAAVHYAAKTLQATMELFNVFEGKLVQEKCSGDRTKFIDELSEQYLNEDFPKRKSKTNPRGPLGTLPEPNIQVVSNAEECKNAVEQLRSHCGEYTVLGFDCEWVPYGKQKVAMLQLATDRGLCALIRLCKMTNMPNELRMILKDKKILKVGIDPHIDAKKLTEDYGFQVNGTVDLARLAKKCKYKARGLSNLAEEVLNVKMPLKKSGRMANKLHKKWTKDTLDDDNIKYAANDVHVSIELFKSFEEKLTGNNQKNLQDFIQRYCSSK